MLFWSTATVCTCMEIKSYPNLYYRIWWQRCWLLPGTSDTKAGVMMELCRTLWLDDRSTCLYVTSIMWLVVTWWCLLSSPCQVRKENGQHQPFRSNEETWVRRSLDQLGFCILFLKVTNCNDRFAICLVNIKQNYLYSINSMYFCK